MENMELLQAMRQMMEEVVSPLYERMDKLDERMDKLDERMDKLDERMEKVETLATKTQIAMENDVVPKIKLLFEGHTILRSRLAQLDEMERILREVQSDVLLLKNIVGWHSGEIRMLKRRRTGN